MVLIMIQCDPLKWMNWCLVSCIFTAIRFQDMSILSREESLVAWGDLLSLASYEQLQLITEQRMFMHQSRFEHTRVS